MAADHNTPAFAALADLASARVGARAIAASDEFFAAKGNLVKPSPAVFIPDKFTTRGKWMDGWESRRRRTPGHDWCVVKLGMRCRIRGLNVNTAFFTGNFPTHCSVDALDTARVVAKSVAAREGAPWTRILEETSLRGDSDNFIAVESDRPWTHVRLNIYPDGGVARFRVHGVVKPDVAKLRSGELADLAAAENGAIVITTNDAFFGPKDNLILPGRATTMGEGWETRRKRVPGFDWIVVKLAVPGTVHKVEVDTNHFKGNFPDMASLEGCFLKEDILDFANAKDIAWQEILPRTKLQAHHRHFYEAELRAQGPFTHVRLNIFPDGGISRLRVHGRAV